MTRIVLAAALAAGCAHAVPVAPPRPCLAGPPPTQVKLDLFQPPEKVKLSDADGNVTEALAMFTTPEALVAYMRYAAEVRAYADGAWEGCRSR